MQRFRYLSEEPPESRAAFQTWLEKVQASEDPLYFSVIDKASGKAAGRQTFMRIEPAHGRIEIGHIHWGPAIARKPAGTEAHYLFMRHAFEELGVNHLVPITEFSFKTETSNFDESEHTTGTINPGLL